MSYKERLDRLLRDPRFIPGVYNYCDRWCERCPLRSRCLNHSLSEEQVGRLEQQDLENEEFWQQLVGVLNETLNMVREMAAEEGLDPDEILKEQDRPADEALDYLPVRLARRYGSALREWFTAKEQLFRAKEAELNSIRLVPGRHTVHRDGLDLRDAIEVISWYQYLIAAKLHRAFNSAASDSDEPADGIAATSADGSAKVALIAMDRSLSAWKIILDHFPAEDRGIKWFIRLLEDLQKRTEMHFPRARSFVRPGFDHPA